MEEDGNSIPQKSIHNNPIKEYQKAIHEIYVFGSEEEQEHSSHTNPINVCF